MTLARPGGNGRSAHGLTLLGPEVWMEDAVCTRTGPEVFFPIGQSTGRPRTEPTPEELIALWVCFACPVMAACQDYGNRMESTTQTYYVHGVIGGETPGQRISRRRRENNSGGKSL